MANQRKNIITIVFIDIEDSTGISNYFEKTAYQDFLSEFYAIVEKVAKQKEWKVIADELHHKFLGDEFVAFFPHNIFGDKNALLYALRFAATLKYQWYFSKHNQKRLKSDKEHIELNIGINTGDVSLMDYPTLFGKKGKKKISFEGFPITLAKRIQSIAEDSQSSRIIVADRFFREYTHLLHKNNEFHFIGKKSFKGIAQRFSCYEWNGGSLYEYLDFGLKFNKTINGRLKTLYNKNPHNPWFANLLASYYFSLGEEQYYQKKYSNVFYEDCADVCLRAISTISTYDLKDLNEILFVCLETTGKWDELCYRAEQAFNADSTFSTALAYYVQSLYKLNNFKKAQENADKLIKMFRRAPLDHESLFIAHFILSKCAAALKKPEEITKHMKSSLYYARAGNIDWAYLDYHRAIEDKEFEIVRHNPDFKKIISKFKKLYDESE